MGTYGYFDNQNREYIITNPRTPVKWVNYIGTLQFGGLVDHTGGSVLCAGDPGLNRITKYIAQLPSSDLKGEGLYLRLRLEDGYQVFSPFFVPTLDDYDSYACHVGLGYQRIVSVLHGIRTDATIFVPPGAPVEIRDIRITNVSDHPVTLDVAPVVEYSHFDALKQFTNADWVPQTMNCDAERTSGGRIILKQYAFMKRDCAVNYFTSNLPVDSFQTDRKRFLGDNDYGSWRNPKELHNAHLSNHEARRGDVIHVLLHAVGTLEPGEGRRLITLLGQDTPDAIHATIAEYLDEAVVDAARSELAAFWEDYLSRNTCHTPCASFNAMVNIHNPRQCHTTMNWSRYLSLYQLGLGSRGLGFRDSAQDAMGAVISAPADTKALLRKVLSVQRPDGSAMHQFYPLTMEADEGDSREHAGKLVYGDDHLWAILSVCAYLKETGDYAFLDESISYYDKDLPFNKRAQGSVLDHLERAIAYTQQNTGKHGLPLLGFADWNDTVNLPGQAESLFNACLYGRALLELIDLFNHLNQPAKAEQYAADHAAMKALVNTHAWDGDWYVRYFTEASKPLGSKTNPKGKIYANGQSWPILAHFAPTDRAHAALDSVFKLLNTECGIKLSTPGYDGYDPDVGGITTYPPGAKENGGIFLHANPWMMIAETMLGNGDRAFQYYRQINPAAKNDDIDRYECEPYCYAQNILGDEHPQFGLGRNSWLSGTASWAYQAATQYILGIRPRHDGLEIDPCIPREWKQFSVRRIWRGTTYEITVRNPEAVSCGVAQISVNGVALTSPIVPKEQDGDTPCQVEVVLGSEAIKGERLQIFSDSELASTM